MTTYEIARHYPNGSLLERYAIHVEASPDEEWDSAIEACAKGETVIRFVNGIEVDRFWNDPQF